MNEEILKRIDLLAVKLGTTAEHVWSVLIRQARMEMWTDLAFGVIMLALAAAGVVVIVKLWDELEEGNFFIGVLSVVFLIIGLVALASAVHEGINPEYWALKQILGAVK